MSFVRPANKASGASTLFEAADTNNERCLQHTQDVKIDCTRSYQHLRTRIIFPSLNSTFGIFDGTPYKVSSGLYLNNEGSCILDIQKNSLLNAGQTSGRILISFLAGHLLAPFLHLLSKAQYSRRVILFCVRFASV